MNATFIVKTASGRNLQPTKSHRTAEAARAYAMKRGVRQYFVVQSFDPLDRT